MLWGQLFAAPSLSRPSMCTCGGAVRGASGLWRPNRKAFFRTRSERPILADLLSGTFPTFADTPRPGAWYKMLPGCWLHVRCAREGATFGGA